MKRLKTLMALGLLLAAFLAVPRMSYGSNEPYAAKPLKGNQIRQDSFSVAKDTVYFDPALKPDQTTFSVRNLVTFKVNEFANLKLPDTFDITLTLKIRYKRNNPATGNPVLDSIVNVNLNVRYNKNAPYPQKSIYTFTGGHETEVIITNVAVNKGTLSQFENSLMLENEIFVTREYTFNCTNHAVTALNTPVYNADKGELDVSWNSQRVADEYDLEWTYIDDSAITNYYLGGDTTKFDAFKIFPNNATRVSIKQTHYFIPLLYDGAGKLFYRVRTVQTKMNGQRIESAWSTDFTNGLGKYLFSGHENRLNWQVTTSFGEEGKRKSVVQYFDGSLRNRQTVTKDNTTDTTIVAETFYDYQGRPAIQVLPSPSLSSIIKYTPNFNAPVNGVEYDKDRYDGLLADSCYCKEGAPAMGTLSGASKYYSPDNQLVNTSYHKYIPDAKGFPFAETRYTPDNTNRVSLQSGVGPDFQIDSGRATRYFYSSADQEELDVLFGTEVGNASHYFKNMVRDANGQYSISYVDMRGRTIATALAGRPATQMDTLTSAKSFSITKKLLDSNTNIIKGTSIESSKGLIVTKAGNHRFRYSLLTDSVSIKACNQQNVCYDCSYDLEITITDDCNNSTLPGGQPYVITRNNLTIDTACNANAQFPGVDESVFLREGNYLVTKKLTISEKAMSDYREIFLRRNTCKTVDSFIAEQKAALNLTCELTCASCNTALGTWETFRPNYMQQMGIPVADTANYRNAAWNAWKELSSTCEDLCIGRSLDKSYRAQMLADMTAPDGQYADPDLDPFKPNEYSIFLSGGLMPYQRVTYLDENGMPDPLNPQNLGITEFAEKFKKSWAEALLQFHPEYPKLQLFEQWKASHEWDIRFENTETYQAAVDSGYLNPANFSGLPAHARYTYYAQRADPLFTSLLPSVKAAMQDSLFNAIKVDGGPNINAWSLATIMAHCPGNDETCRQAYTPVNQAFVVDVACSGELDVAWRYFREIYLQKKREIMDAQLNTYAEGIKGIPGYYNYLFNAGYAVTFVNPTLAATGGLTDLVDDTTQAKDSIDAFILDNCRAYAMQWWEEMKPCNFSDEDSVDIINRLIQVCKEGGDETHLFGASTVKPSSTSLDRSFEQVIREYAGGNYNSTCNVYLLTAPLPYDKQPVYYDKPIMQKPDSCECATISNLYSSYQLAGVDANFSDYIYRTTHTRIYNGVLDTLRKACSGEINCSFLKEPLVLAPVLQCGGGQDVCVTCDGVDTVYKKFRQQFPAAVPSYEDADSLQHAYNALFERFMNTNLGFSKKTAEYLDFLYSCSTTSDKYCNVALGFDGTTGKRRVTIPVRNNRLNLGTSDFTFEARIKPKTNTTFNAILTNRTTSSGTTGDGFIWVVFQGQLLIQLQGCYNYQTVNTGGIDLYDGRPHQVAVSRQGDSLGFYVDGIKVPYAANCTGTVTTPPSQRNISTNGPWYIGLDTTGTLPTPLAGFAGWMDEVRIWNVARTPAQIAANLSARLSPQSNLMGYYLLRSKDTCEQSIQDYSTTDTRLKNNGYLGSSPVKDVLDPTWLTEKQISYTSSDPVGIVNDCGSCSSGNIVCDSLQNILNDYKQYGAIPHLDASKVDTTNWRVNFGGTLNYRAGVPFGEVIKNGVLALPRYYTDTLPNGGSYWQVNFDRIKDTLCFDSSGFTFETRLRLPDSLVHPNGFNDSWWIILYSDPAAAGSLLVSLKLTPGNGAAICTHQSDPKGVCTPLYVPNMPLDNWRTVRLQFRKRLFSYYIDSVLVGTAALDAPMTKIYWWTLLQYSQRGEVDYIRIYDTTGKYLYKEEFDDPYRLARGTSAAKCNGCQPGFVQYFNQRTGGSYTYSQIQTLYSNTCNVQLGDCPDKEPPLTLCGRSEPVFPPVTVNQHSPCDDSTLFAVSKGTLLYEAYRDSILNSFDDRYLAKCLNARYAESFTVEQTINEFHYTLYYYDQAGNLAKTIPPAGVDVSKFAWAVNWSDSVKTARRNKQVLKPNHVLRTEYRYNTLNQVVAQLSPDGGHSQFWYDRLGRLTVSQNAKQRAAGSSNDQDRQYSYTKYDVLGRITEVGQMSNTSANGVMSDVVSRNAASLDSWLLALNNRRGQITQTIYDQPYSGFIGVPDPRLVIAQRNLRNRVSYVTYTENSNPSAHNQGTFYSYDILGNVDTLLQDYGCGTCGTLATYNMMNRNGNSRKKFVYQYDLISGKVNMMMYQNGWSDMWLHRYSYDAENRLTLVETSNDSLVWEKDARYEYYKHGPLARTVIGEQLVQGVDYAYTLQGWLKGVNSTGSTSAHDIGGDGRAGSLNQYVARDALGFNLNYFVGDYKAINTGVSPFPAYRLVSGGMPDSVYRPLYNGNISSMATYIRRFEGAEPALLTAYKYDQLNRLTRQDVYKSFNPSTNSYSGLQHSNMFRERVSYDANGNILTYRRNAGAEFNNLMDDLTYQYYPGSNQLKRVDDAIDSSKYGANSWDIILDIDDQLGDTNYVYDAIGNLIQDKHEKITNIKWNVYGKIMEITRNATAGDKVPTTRIRYTYDAQGNRISQVVEKAGSTTKDFTWYVRDAQGNMITTYKASGNVDTTTLNNLVVSKNEHMIYGSSRLGSHPYDFSVDGGPTTRQFYSGGIFERGWRQYELSNHLGNVLTTISDKKIGVSSGAIGAPIDYYDPEIISATDYYPFGMVSRVATSSTGKDYRFGFNGKENDNGVKGFGNQQDYGMRIYDPRVARFLSVDPISKSYPELTPYQFASNRPIDGIDLDGLEHVKTIPKFEYTGENKPIDYLSAFENGIINVLNLVPTTWNSIVSTVQSARKGTYVQDLKSESKQAVSQIKQGAKSFVQAPFKTLAKPETLEFLTTIYVGGKSFSIGPKSGNILTPMKPIGPTKTIYRGVNESNAGFENALKGIVKPNGGTATALEHNTVSTLNSPFTSWTTDWEVAVNFALRPNGYGVVLEKSIPINKLTKSPNLKSVQLKGTKKIVSESEVLLKGEIKVSPQNITTVTN